MINISNDTLLITILVGVLAVYTIITLDDKKEEKFTESSQNSENTSNQTNNESNNQENTNNETNNEQNNETNNETNNESNTNDNTTEGNGTGDAGSNTEAVSEKSKQDIVQSNDKKTTVIHNHYYGGNKQLAKFMNELVKKQNQEENNNQRNLVDQGMCSELNNKLKTKTLAEIQNDRVLSDLKNKCDNWGNKQDTCKIQPPLSQTALIGTLLTDAKNTSYGSLLPKVKSM